MEFTGILRFGKYGGYVSLSEAGVKIPLNRDEAFLDHVVHPVLRVFEEGKRYLFEMHYGIIYPKTPDKADMNWSNIRGSSVEEILDNPLFKKHNLEKDRIVPYLQVVREAE